jgi:tRNA U34 2-thiouridine synthase MnmA/TrmU
MKIFTHIKGERICPKNRGKAKALVLFSGGLDSILTIKLLQESGINVEAINFSTPFSAGQSYVDSIAKKFRVKVHKVKVDAAYFSMIRKPRHGYGANMNPCLDCKIYMFRRAAAFAKKRRFDFMATGEVLGERPFSQIRPLMFLIEKEAGLDGKIVRPLSGKLLPETEAEKKGLISRENMLAISGRNRTPQLGLAKKFGIKEFPSPGGGCLLTDPAFANKLRDFLKYSSSLSWGDVELLRLGRHFRLGREKVIVGRRHEENLALKKLAIRQHLPWMEVREFMGPVTVLQGKSSAVMRKAADLTFRYSDAPKDRPASVVLHTGKARKVLEAGLISEQETEKLRV